MTTGKLAATLGVLLFLSLAGNVFQAGYFLGQRAGDAAPEQPAPDNDKRKAWQKRDEALRQKLSPEDLKIFEAARDKNRPKIEALKAELDKARENVLAAQTADPFDQQALDAAVEEEAEKKTVFLQAIREMRKDIFTQLSPEGRKEMRKLHARDGHKGKDGRRSDAPRGDRRDKIRERIRERIENGERPMMRREGGFRAEQRRMPPPSPEMDGEMEGEMDGPPPAPSHDAPPSPPDYDEPPPPPPPHDEDCGGCEGPPGGDPAFLEP